jgi:hypothetical protein
MRVASAAMLLAMIASPLAAQEKLGPMDLFVIGNFIASVRGAVLQDSTRISFCAIDEFWDAKGNLLLEETAAKRSRYLQRSSCPKNQEQQEKLDDQYVNLSQLRVFADSLTILGTTRRGSMFLFERYKLKGRAGSFHTPEYLVFAIGHNNVRD